MRFAWVGRRFFILGGEGALKSVGVLSSPIAATPLFLGGLVRLFVFFSLSARADDWMLVGGRGGWVSEATAYRFGVWYCRRLGIEEIPLTRSRRSGIVVLAVMTGRVMTSLLLIALVLARTYKTCVLVSASVNRFRGRPPHLFTCCREGKGSNRQDVVGPVSDGFPRCRPGVFFCHISKSAVLCTYRPIHRIFLSCSRIALFNSPTTRKRSGNHRVNPLQATSRCCHHSQYRLGPVGKRMYTAGWHARVGISVFHLREHGAGRRRIGASVLSNTPAVSNRGSDQDMYDIGIVQGLTVRRSMSRSWEL